MDSSSKKGSPLSLEERQEASLEALQYFHDYCVKHGLTYCLAYGTLLGAIRHKGFIPWDDDVDVFVPRPDYETLQSSFNQKADSQYRFVSCYTDPAYHLPYAKIENLRTARLSANQKPGKQGLGMDIFPLDGLPEDLNYAKEIFEKRNQVFIETITRYEYYHRLTGTSIKAAIKRSMEKISTITNRLSRISKSISECPYDIPYEKSDKVACVTGLYSGRFCVFDKEWVETESTFFEGHELLIPKGYHQILQIVYGDYMTPPPEESRTTTHTDQFVWR